jgi:hypothetical protein
MCESVLVHADLTLYLIELVLCLHRLLLQDSKRLGHVQRISDPLISFHDILGRHIKLLEPFLSLQWLILAQPLALLPLLCLGSLRHFWRGLPHHWRDRLRCMCLTNYLAHS